VTRLTGRPSVRTELTAVRTPLVAELGM